MTVDVLKAENNQLKTGVSRPPSSTSQSSGLGSLGTSSPRQSVASLSKTFSMGATECLNTGEDYVHIIRISSYYTEEKILYLCFSWT